MSNQVADFQKLRRKRTAARLMRRMLLLLLAAMLVVAGLALVRRLEFTSLSTWPGDLYASLRGGPGFPLESPGEGALQLLAIGNDPVLLTDTNLNIYNAAGRLIASYQHGCRTPIARQAGARLLTYDRSGKNLRVDTRSQNLYTAQYPAGILAAGLAKNGNLAVATAADYYQAQITVYSPGFQELFTWFTSDYQVYDLALSQDGSLLAVAAVDAREGRIYSSLIFFSLDSETPQAVVELPGELVYSLLFGEDGALQVVSSDSLRLYDNMGIQQGMLAYEGRRLLYFDNTLPGRPTVALDTHGDGNTLTLATAYNALADIYQTTAQGPVLGLRSLQEGALLLTGHSLTTFNSDLTHIQQQENNGLLLCAPTADYIYTFSPAELDRLWLEKLPEASQ